MYRFRLLDEDQIVHMEHVAVHAGAEGGMAFMHMAKTLAADQLARLRYVVRDLRRINSCTLFDSDMAGVMFRQNKYLQFLKAKGAKLSRDLRILYVLPADNEPRLQFLERHRRVSRDAVLPPQLFFEDLAGLEREHPRVTIASPSGEWVYQDGVESSLFD